jgi:SAM-dependent MidA family methyltransferase
MALADIVIQKIKEEGPISFRDFMEMALYYPELGYYTSHADKIGTKGDYYTSSNLTSVFGAMIGRQLEEMWATLGEEAFTIVEYGAGTGRLCHDILDYLKSNQKLYEQLRYCIIEKSPAMRTKERVHLDGKVSWHESIDEIRGFTGCVLSNELLDNFSVHRVVMQDELMELFVDYRDGFTEIPKPASAQLKNYFSELNVTLSEGYCTEVSLEAVTWIQEVATALSKGYVITIDYGYLSQDLYNAQRSQGTLMCYSKHQINDCLYEDIGLQDITAHVNFSGLHHWGVKSGLQGSGFTDQAHFLLGLGFVDYLNKSRGEGNISLSAFKQDAFLKHTLLFDMGSRFKVFIQHKGVPYSLLSGLKLAEPVATTFASEDILPQLV